MNGVDLIRAYWASFNEADYAKTGATFFTENCVFEMPGHKVMGRENIVKDFIEGHKVVKSTLTPVNVVAQGNLVVAELVAQFEVLEDNPNFPVKPVKKGDTFTMRDAVFYELTGNKISYVRLYRFLGVPRVG